MMSLTACLLVRWFGRRSLASQPETAASSGHRWCIAVWEYSLVDGAMLKIWRWLMAELAIQTLQAVEVAGVVSVGYCGRG